MGRWTAALVVLVAFGSIAYRAGQLSGAPAQAASLQSVPAQLTLRPEVIPFPAPDHPGQTPGQSQDCQPMILFYYNGKLYQLMPGPDSQNGSPSSPPEYYPLRPYQGPQIPGLPFAPSPLPMPQGPEFHPVQPRL
jgi:hypothetical protein